MFTMLKRPYQPTTAIFIESTTATQTTVLLCDVQCTSLQLWVSIKAFAFFFIYMVQCGYTATLKNLWASNVFASLLAITPFFVIGLYFNNLSTWVMFMPAIYFIILIRDLVKDLQNFRGLGNVVVICNVSFGIRTTKAIISVLIVYSKLFFIYYEKNQLGGMFFTFYCPYLPFWE